MGLNTRTSNAAVSKLTDSSKSGSKYGPGDKFDKYKSVHFSKDSKHFRDNEGVEVAFYLLTRCYISRVHAMTLVSIPCIVDAASPRATAAPRHSLFDTGANPTSFVNRQVAAWIESQ